LSKRAVL